SVSTAQASVQETRSTAVARAALATVEAALDSGEPYNAALARVAENTEIEIPEGLRQPATTGVATLAALRTSFADAANGAIRTAIRTGRDEGGVGGRLAAYIESQVATRSLEPREGDTVDAVLSRAEDALRQDNLAAAVAELDALPPAAAEVMSAWLERSRLRVAAVEGYQALDAALAN
ncbi:MAG: mitofilin family membrane protein, partial [Pseudomonadota bacterium]